nr:MAG TPA: Protein of unknown function (DUF2786) [Caudoviricetes sp.]
MAEKNIISKIEKLLALAGNNPSEAEAQAAMLKAQKLMAEHNLDMAQFKDQPQEKKEAVTEYFRGYHNTDWAIRLAQVICNNFRCNLLRAPHYGLVFVGLKEDVAICKAVFTFAAQTLDKNMKKLRRQYRKAGKPTDGISGDYSAGFIAGLQAKYKEQVDKNNWGLVLVKDALVEQLTKNIINPKGKITSGKKLKQSGDPGLYAKGYLDGKSLGDDQKALQA